MTLSSGFLFGKSLYNPGSGLQILADRLTLCCGLNRSRGAWRTPAINNRTQSLEHVCGRTPFDSGAGYVASSQLLFFSCRMFIYAYLLDLI
jgi:hypothetical protein